MRAQLSRVLHVVADALDAIAWWFRVRAETVGDGGEIAR